MPAKTAGTDAKPRKGRKTENDALPTAGNVRDLAADVRSMTGNPLHRRAFAYLHSLAPRPPRALLLEGGTAGERVGAALYWSLLLNCGRMRTSPKNGGSVPCFSCPTCLRFLGRMHRDLFFLDGESGSITIDEARSVRATLGETAREAEYRVVVLSEAQRLTEAAANAMLKSLEEALPATVFVLTVPQRERLLPTLVSRCWVLTLAWPDPLTGADETGTDSGDEPGWAATAADFLFTGKGLFARTGARGGVDASSAARLTVTLQRAAAQALSGVTGKDIAPGTSPEADLVRFFASLPENRLSIALSVLAEGQDSLNAQVNPSLVADWIMTRLYLLRPTRRS